jgi:Domain of unknown function (DUF4421)
MRKFIIVLFILFSMNMFADGRHRKGDTLHLFEHIDTTYIAKYRDLFTVKLIGVVRTNQFSIKDNVSNTTLGYSINTNANLGFGVSLKGIGFEFQYNPPGLNNDDAQYGKSKQISFATNANGRRFIYDVFYRYNQGYHTVAAYRTPNDTSGTYQFIYRPDMKNTYVGGELIYVFNNKKFSSSAPYNLTQKQRKSAGSLLVGTLVSSYSIAADSVIVPDTIKKYFQTDIQFKEASAFTWGFSCGYTYTLVFAKNWFVNIYTLPGLVVQQYYSINNLNQKLQSKVNIGGALQSRFSIGYNRKNYFIGISWMNTNFLIDNDKKSAFGYKSGVFRFYYGHRFDVRKILKKRF